jgi:Flp pilus assembly protein TadG
MALHTFWLSRRMARDRRGVSAIEFAMIAPVLILFYVGIVEVANLLTLHRRTASVASTAADLTAQVKTVTTADLEDIVKASGALLTPYPTTPLKVVLSSVVADSNNVGKVSWSYASKGGARANNSTYPLPAGVTQADSSVIVAEVTYNYTPTLGLNKVFSPGAFEMKRTFYSRPRRSLAVTKN